MLIAILITAFPWASLWGSTRDAARHTREGIRQHRSGQYKAAEQAFSAAAEALPDDPRIAFNQACALAAQGKADEAADLLRTAALARDPALAASSHYNLGCLKASQAKALFGEQPEEAGGEVREQGLGLLDDAVAHYRDCLRVAPDHQAARHNLELLRLWIKNMQDLWARRDRQRRRQEMDLLAFLEMLISEQRALRAADRALAQDDLFNSAPRQRQAIAETGRQQRELAEEIEPLQQKIEQALQGPAAAAAPNPPAPATGAEAERALELLTQFALRAKSAMFQAADDLAVHQLEPAIQAQTEALQALDDIYRAVAAFESVLEKATALQEQLVGSSQHLVQAEPAPETTAAESQPLAEDQSFVAGWSGTLAPKATQALAQLSALPPPDPSTDPQNAQAGPGLDDLTRDALKATYEKAIELGPQIEQLAREAAEQLQRQQWPAALPKQEEALRMLKEIAEQQPKQQQEQEQQQDQQQQEQEQQEQGEQEQQQEKDQQQQQQQPSDEDQQQQQRNLTRQQAEALLRRVREREREHRERQKQLQQYLRGGAQVDKDW